MSFALPDGADDSDENDSPKQLTDLISWLKSTLARVMNGPKAGGAIEKNGVVKGVITIVLDHIRANDKRTVETYDYQPGDDVEDLASSILARGAADAVPNNGGTYTTTIVGVGSSLTIRFGAEPDARVPGVLAEREDDGMAGYEERPAGSRPRDLQGRSSAMMIGGGGGPENPVAQMFGIMTDYARMQTGHTEKLLEHTTTGHVETVRQMTAVMKEQAETIRGYDKHRMANMGLVEDLYSKKHERDREMARERKNDEIKDKVVEMAGPAFKSIAARFLGASGIPQELAPALALANDAFSGMDGTQLEALMESPLLTDKQKRALFELLKVASQVESETPEAGAPTH